MPAVNNKCKKVERVEKKHDKTAVSTNLDSGMEGILVEEAAYCVDCGREVAGSQLGLECDSCGFWHHAGCEKVRDDVYSFFSSHEDEKSILWYCKKCVVTCKRMSSNMALMHDHQQHLEERTSNIWRRGSSTNWWKQ